MRLRERVCVTTVPWLDDLQVLKAQYHGHAFPLHFHDTYVLAFIEEGIETFESDGRKHEAPAGSIILLNPGAVHDGTSGNTGVWRYGALYPSIALIRDTLGIASAPAFESTVVQSPALFKAVHSVHGQLMAGTTDSAIRDALCELLVELTETLVGAGIRDEPEPDRRDRTLAQLTEYMREKCTRDVTLDDLARLSGYSSFHVIRLFKAAFGLTPRKYLIGLRIERAREMLLSGSDVSHVSHHLGFSAQSHFTRTFKRYLGTTPGAFSRG